jgi:large subunit ribosomal protein L24
MAGKTTRGKVHLKRGDVVEIIAGDDSAGGKTGKVMVVFREKNRAIVEGVNLVKKHMKKSQDYPQGGIVEKEAPIHISNLRVVTRGSGGRGEA